MSALEKLDPCRTLNRNGLGLATKHVFSSDISLTALPLANKYSWLGSLEEKSSQECVL